MESLLRIEKLTKYFPAVVANDGITLDVKRGEIHCLLGENGAGKTTLAECVYGYYQPDDGRVYFKGEQVDLGSPSDAIDLGIGMVHQHFILVPPLTVVENVVVGTQTTGVLLDLSQAETRLASLCERYGVDLDLRAKIWQLSVGEQQWVEILKALYVGSELLILDEPTAVLTPQETERLFHVLEQMTEDGLSIIFITHKLNEVMQVSDRVSVLRKGKLVATVKTQEVTKSDLARMMVGREVIFRVEKSEAAAGAPVLQVHDLRARGDRGQEALKAISFDLLGGEILGIAGVAGNGQSELFEVIIGVRPAEAGQILLEGEDITGASTRSILSGGVAHIPEDRVLAGLVPDFTVAENLILGRQRSDRYRRALLLDEGKIRAHASDCVSAYDIQTPSVEHVTKFLSGGNLQKVILARELWQSPRVLLAHQPTRGLDVGVIEYVHRQLLGKRDEGVGIILASEDLEELFNLSDRLLVMYKGQVMGIFRVEDISLERVGLLMAGVEEARG